VYQRLDQLPSAPRNPKRHDVDVIAASIERHGFVGAVLVCERKQCMVGGHGRKKALLSLRERGRPMPDGLLIDDDGEWLVPVARGWASKDDAHFEQMVIADNRATVLGGWDDSTLASMLEDLQCDHATLFDELAFTVDDLDRLFRTDPPADPNRADPVTKPTTDGDDLDDDVDEATTPPARREVRCPECGSRFPIGGRPGDND
jgi:hypothetical protein